MLAALPAGSVLTIILVGIILLLLIFWGWMMKSLRKKIRGRYFRKVVIYFLAWCMVLNTSLPIALAEVVLQPGGEINGSITVTPLDGGTTQSMTASNGAIGHFSDFDIAATHVVTCTQTGGPNPNALFRVFSGDGTQILGQFDANGNIFLIDPAGILFGADSVINVNQLIASSLDISNDDFLAGQYEFVAGEGDIGAIVNDGTINAAEGVALIGRQILNTGTITTGEGGFVVLAAGDRVLLGDPGSQILTEMYSVALGEEGDGDIINDGEISAPAGTVVLATGDVFASALELPKVSSGIGRIEQNGHIHADGTTGDGGNVGLTAADEVIIASLSETTANAGTDGDAGLVVVHSVGRTIVEPNPDVHPIDPTLEVNPQIQATGGHVPDNSDFDDVVDTTVEISGDYVNLAGVVDASAITEGKRGKIVIDALDITVVDGSMPVDPPDNTIYEEWIEQQTKLYDDYNQEYVSTDVELVAHSKDAGNITVQTIGDGEITGGSGDIVMRTKYDTGGITFLGDPAAIYSTAGGNVYMLAGGDDPETEEITEGSIIVGDIISTVPQSIPAGWPVEPGKIRLLTVNGGSITTGELKVEGGSYDEISVIASGDLTINGDVTTYAHQVDEGLEVGQARTCLVSEHGDVEINGEIKVEAHAKDITNADIHIDAGRDIRIDLNGGQILASAFTSADGIANASVKIHAGTDTDPSDPTEKGVITIINPKSEDKAIDILAQAGGKKSEISSSGQDPEYEYKTDGGTKAELDIDDKRTAECADCPKPPGLIPPLDPWAFTTHMRESIDGNVFGDEIGILEVIPDESWGVLDPDTWEVETNHGTLIIMRDGSYYYMPEEGFVGQDRFTYKAKVTDTGVETDMVEVTITVSNELPVANPGSASNHMGYEIVGPLNTNDVDDIINETPYKDVLDVEIVEQPLHGTVTVQKDGDTWTYTYTPTTDENGEYHAGTDSFTYSVTDGQFDGEGNPIEVLATVDITLVNTPPIQSNDTVTIGQGESVVIDVLANDYDPDHPVYMDELTVVQDSITVKHGKLILNDDNTFTYIPDPGYVGKDVFTYAVKDGQSGQNIIWTTVVIWVNSTLFVPAAPVPEPIAIQVTGCPALVKWAAAELGSDEKKVQIQVANSLASTGNIQPCDACGDLKEAAAILQDVNGERVAALAGLINEFASSDAPPTEEQMASIADAIANDIEDNVQYAAAGEYLDALAKYVGILNSELGFSADESVQFATNNYVEKLVTDENVGVAAYVAARLAALGGSQ